MRRNIILTAGAAAGLLAAGGITKADPSNQPLETVANYAALRSLPTAGAGTAVQVLGANAPGDGGDGIFFWDPNSPPAGALNDNIGVVLQSSASTTGVWRRAGFELLATPNRAQTDTGPIALNVKWFGLVADGATDNASLLSKLISVLQVSALNGAILVFPIGTYYIGSNVTVPGTLALQHDGGVLKIASGVTLAIQGDVIAAAVHIYSYLGTPAWGKGVVFHWGTMREINPIWFGADPIGVQDSTNAIQNCFNSAAGSGLVNQNTAATIHFTYGVYLISSSLTSPGQIRGDNAILCFAPSNSTTDFFVDVEFAFITGMQFANGRNIIACTNIPTLNNGWVFVDLCYFTQQAGAVLYTDTSGPNLTVTMTRCQVQSNASTASIVTAQSGLINLHDWIGQAVGTTTFYISGALLQLDNMWLAPSINGGQFILVDRGGGLIDVRRTRFGGEAGKTIITWQAQIVPSGFLNGQGSSDPIDNGIIFRDNYVYSSNGNAPIFQFYTLPMVLKFSGNQGPGWHGIHFDPGIPQDQRNAIGAMFNHEFPLNQKNVLNNTTDPEISDRMFTPVVNDNAPPQIGSIELAFMASSLSYGAYSQNTDLLPLSNPNDRFGQPGLKALATGPGGIFIQEWTTALSGLAVGPHTLVLNVDSNRRALDGRNRGWRCRQIAVYSPG